MSGAVDTLRSRDDSLKHYSAVRGPLDKWMFFIFFLVGALAVLTARVRFAMPQEQVIVMPVLLMLGYMALVKWVPMYRLREDQVGDNLYYLGFLYTLTSLAIALYYFANQAQALDQIVTNFGIALATTIVGVALRVVMHQMREDPLDTEREARETLAQASSRLRAELDSSVRSMSTFSIGVQQVIEEALNELGTKANGLLEESSVRVAKATDSASEGIAEAFRHYNDQVEHLTQTSQKQIAAIEKLTEKLDAIDIPSDLIEQKLSPPIEKLVLLVDKSMEHQEAEEERRAELAKAIPLVTAAATEVKKHTQSVSESLDGITKNAATLSLIVSRLGSVPEQVDKALESTQRFARIQKEMSSIEAGVLKEHKDRLIQLQNGLEEAISTFREVIRTQTAQANEESYRLIKRAGQEQEALLDQLASQAKQSLSEIKELRSTTQKEAREAHEATHDVLRQLSSMVKTLGSEMGGTSRQAPLASVHGTTAAPPSGTSSLS